MIWFFLNISYPLGITRTAFNIASSSSGWNINNQKVGKLVEIILCAAYAA